MGPLPPPRTQVTAALVATGALLVGAYVVLEPFLVPIAWAAILAYVTWPIYRRVRHAVGGRADRGVRRCDVHLLRREPLGFRPALVRRGIARPLLVRAVDTTPNRCYSYHLARGMPVVR